MTAYIVTYDLNKEAKRPNLLGKIKEWPWARLSESSYAISTTATASDVFNQLRPFIDDNDNLFVIPLKSPYMGWGQKEVHEWLAQNL